MPICSYLVIPGEGARPEVLKELEGVPGCDVIPAENRDVLMLVTETTDPVDEDRLRAEIYAIDGIEALLFTFGEIDPDTPARDPLASHMRRPR
mgnify:CR=1 FL=1